MHKRTEHRPDGYDHSTEIALFRYGLVAPVIHTPPPAGQMEQALRDLASQCYQSPTSACTKVSVTTLRRYLKAYQSGGFDALRPAPRASAVEQQTAKARSRARGSKGPCTQISLSTLLKRCLHNVRHAYACQNSLR